MPSTENKEKKAADKAEKPKSTPKKSDSEKKDSPKKAPAKKKESSTASVPEIPADKLKCFIAAKESFSQLGRLRLLKILLLIKEGKLKVGDASEGALTEDDAVGERNPIAKVENTKGELDSYAAQKQRIEFTDKELQSVIGFKDQAQPSQQDKFVVKFQTTNGDGENITTIVQKEREGQVFNFVAYAKKENSNNQGLPGQEPSEPEDDGGDDDGGDVPDLSDLKENELPSQGQEITAEDDIVITKSITFADDSQSSDILADFLRALEI